MSYQSAFNAYAAYEIQSALGTQASGAGAKILRQTGGQGGRLSKASIESMEVRNDGMSTRGRHGSQKTAGAYTHEFSIGSIDDILEAVMRGTYSAANLAITQSAMTSITTGTSTIVAAAGSWITEGLRVGDIIRLTGHSTAANNSRNLRITGLTALTITVAETLTADAVADATFTVTRTGRKLINPAAGSLVKRYFTLEEYEADIDQSELLDDFVWTSIRFSGQSNGHLMADPGGVGTGKFATLATGSAPHFTSPAESTGLPLAVLDGSLLVGGTNVVDLTSFDLTIDIVGNAPDIAFSKFAPDIFTGQMQVSMNLTALRQDLLKVDAFVDETPMSLHLLAVENETEPEDFLSIYVPNFTFGGVDKSPLSKRGEPRTQTISIPPALVGKDMTGGAFDPTMVKFQISNAT